MSSRCIQPNPDISGIGIRTATYAQNLLSFGPAIHALMDKQVTLAELDSREIQSTTILFTAFAILLSTIVQAQTRGLTNFHATIILNLSWMNNTSTFIYFLLFVHHKLKHVVRQDEAEKRRRVLLRWSSSQAWAWVKMISRDKVLVIGSLHLSLMAGVGLWLWSQPASFGGSPMCAMSAHISILGQSIQLSSTGLRGWSLFIYALLLVPGFNLIIPIIFVLIVPYLAYTRLMPKIIRHDRMSRIPVYIGLGFLAVINVVFLVDTEIEIHRNRSIQEGGESESEWTFGQTLALLLLLAPLDDLVGTFLQTREKKDLSKALAQSLKELPYPSHDQLRSILRLIQRGAEVDVKGKEYDRPLELVLLAGQAEILKYMVKHGANIHAERYHNAVQAIMWQSKNKEMVQFLANQGICINSQVGYFGTPLQAASRQGNLDVVRSLIECQADINFQCEPYGTALHAASSAGNLKIVQLLIDCGADVNIQGGPYGTALQAASYAGHKEIVKCLLEDGHADLNINGGWHGTALQTAKSRKHSEIVAILRAHEINVNSV